MSDHHVKVSKSEMDQLLAELKKYRQEREELQQDVKLLKSRIAYIVNDLGIKSDKKPNSMQLMAIVPKIIQRIPEYEQIFQQDIKPLLEKYATE